MPKEPTPRYAEEAEAAEARLKALRGRFSRISGSLGRGGSGGGPRQSLSRVEWLIVAGVAVFLIAVGGMAVG